MTKTRNRNSSPIVEKISGVLAEGIDVALDLQSPTLACCKKYQQKYLSNNRICSMHRVYISEEMHELLTRIAGAVGKDKASAGAYLTEIVKDHFERNRDTVNAIYLMNTQPLF